jgi:hypothetical protein
MIKIRLSSPWTHIDFNQHVPSSPVFGSYQYDFEPGRGEYDYWIIWGGIKGTSEEVICPPQNIIYLTDEVHDQRYFNQRFLDQFAAIVTCRTDLNHRHIVPTHELNTWMIDQDYDFVSAPHLIPKSKKISVVCSDQTWLPGHKLRFALVNKLIGHFKDRLDVYGKGFNPVKDKYDALRDYKYSIAIENSVIPGYFTEKLTDCFLSHTLPVYFGCPDIGNYFDLNAMCLIDPTDFYGSVRKIEELLEKDPYESLLTEIINQKNRYLDTYHIFHKLPRILTEQFPIQQKKQLCSIKAESTFQQGARLNYWLHRFQQLIHLPEKRRFSILFRQTLQ